MTTPPSPAALRLKAARRAYAGLRRAVRLKDHDGGEFSRALDQMLSNPPSKTCALHDWSAQILMDVLWSDPANRAARLEEVLARTDALQHLNARGQVRGQAFVRRCVATRAFDLLPVLASSSLVLGTSDTDIEAILEPLFRGQWPHPDLISPTLFTESPRGYFQEKWEGSSGWALCRVEDALFDYRLYAEGAGFFSTHHMRRLLPLCAQSEWFRQELLTNLGRSRENGLGAKPPGEAPWLEGLAMAVAGGLLPIADLEEAAQHRSHLATALPAIRARAERLQLEQATPEVSPPSPASRLRL